VGAKVLYSKLQNVLNLFVFLLFINFPVQLAKHFWPNFAYIWGIRVDYLAPTIFFSDILLMMVLGLYLFQGGFRKVKLNYFQTTLLFFWVGLNILWAINPQIALLKFLKFGELGLFIYFLATNQNINVQKLILNPLLISSEVVSMVGIIQFLKGSTLGGIFYFLGERHFNLETPGIALVSLAGKNYLRAYSFFSHPNSLAGYLLVIMILVFFFAKKQRFYLIPLLVCFFLTFSKGAFLTLALITLFTLVFPKIKKQSKSALQKMVMGILASLIFVSGAMFIKNWSGWLDTDKLTVNERMYLIQVSEKLILERPIFGLGLNNFVLGVPARLLQPVHNIYILSIVEGGVIGLALLMFLLFKLLRQSLKTGYYPLFLSLLVILVTGLFDHYWFNLQQNLLMASLVFGLTFRGKIQ
jgi:O-antigen ligase